ncbi:predicted protein [Chaetoceros tenuissimus]|uniref:F-box domain-containing protein n=1 Tax=Chaetoceros tenuissimus TaxID=426638 RepID=A0AAD3CPK3_9STRA|nr:predicted protein [Chaetoceros tenuissimus]
MDKEGERSNRKAANEVDNITFEDASCVPLPDHLVRHCLSFVGGGNYYFVASVSKQLKNCVEMEFPDDRNTSAFNIIANEEIFVAFIKAFTASKKEGDELERVQIVVQRAIFETDDVDMYENIYIGFFLKIREEPDEAMVIHRLVWPAVTEKSIEIMKHIISNDETLSKMKEIDVPGSDEYEDADPVKFASCVTSACDVEMIEYLRDKGVEFNARSIDFALIGGRMDTVRHLLDFVPSDLEGIHYSVLCDIAIDACKSDGYEGLRVLKEKGWLRGPLLSILYECVEQMELPVDAIKIFINEESDFETEIKPLVGIALKHRRLDIMKYLHPSLLYLDVEATMAGALENGDEEFAEFLRPLL